MKINDNCEAIIENKWAVLNFNANYVSLKTTEHEFSNILVESQISMMELLIITGLTSGSRLSKARR